MNFIVVFSLFAFVAIASSADQADNGVDSATGYPDWCAKGQVVWCKNFTNAVQCDAVNHCIQTVWLNTKTVGDDDSCKSCVNEVNNIRKGLSSNTTKEYLKDALDNLCKQSFWTKIFKKFCVQLIDTYVDNNLNALLDLLSSSVDSRTVCSILFFCETSSMTATVKKDVAVVRYRNVVLHLPAHFIDANEAPKLLGNEKCTWGPSYWCDNLSSSKECKMTSHCIESVWSKKRYDDDNDSVCKICKDMVQQARDQLQSNETQEELREVFEGSCKLIPLKQIRTECLKLADDFVPELTDMLVQEMNPTAVCTVAGLCNSARIDNLLAAADASAPTELVSDSCTNCTIAFAAVQGYLASAPADDALDKLLRLCGLLSSYSDACSILMVTHFEDVYAMLKNWLEPFAACHLSGMCAQKYHFHPSAEDTGLRAKVDAIYANANDQLSCDVCTQVLTDFKNMLVVNTTEKEFLQVLRGICTQTGKFQPECLQIGDEDFRIIYKFLTEEFNPKETCRELDQCPRGNVLTDESLNLIYSRPAQHQTSASLVPAQSPQTSASLVPARTSSGVECKFCKTIVRTIQSELKKPKYEHDIEKAIKEVCTLVPAADKAKCDRFVDQYADELIKMLANQTDPQVICGMLEYCDTLADHPLCPLCQTVMEYVEKKLDDPKDVRRIEKTVEKVCEYVPADQTNCKRFVSEYSSLIVSILAAETDPKLVCPALKLCPSLMSADDRCVHCQTLMYDFVDRLGGNRQESNVRRELDAFVPAGRDNVTAVALELKFSHPRDIVEMMEANFDGVESCTYLQFCDAKTVTPVVEHRSETAAQTNDIAADVGLPTTEAVTKPSCEICERFVRMYEDKLGSTIAEHEVEMDFLRYCDRAAEPQLQLNCSRLVDRYLPLLTSLLKRDVKPGDLCGLAKLCPLRATNTFSIESMQECRICEIVVGAVQSVQADPYVEGSTVSEIGKVCDVLDRDGRSECATIVNELAPHMAGGLVREIPSWYYCVKLDRCPYREHLIDPTACSKAELWCDDLKTAVVCDKLEHCRQNVWKSAKPIRN